MAAFNTFLRDLHNAMPRNYFADEAPDLAAPPVHNRAACAVHQAQLAALSKHLAVFASLCPTLCRPAVEACRAAVNTQQEHCLCISEAPADPVQSKSSLVYQRYQELVRVGVALKSAYFSALDFFNLEHPTITYSSTGTLWRATWVSTVPLGTYVGAGASKASADTFALTNLLEALSASSPYN
jgi:hypothetical protein